MKTYLGVDLGTSSIKVGLFDDISRLLSYAERPYDVRYVEYNGAEQSPDDWWNALVLACEEIEASDPEKWRTVSSVGVTGQFSGTVPVSEKGEAIRDAIIWLDSRGEEQTRRTVSGFPSISGYRIDKLYRWIRLTGGAPTRSGKDSISHILYLKEKEPEVYRSAYKFLEPKDYINFRLTEKHAGTFDSMVLNWITDNRNPSDIHYSDKLLKMAGISLSKFPRLIGSWEPLGKLSQAAAGILHLGGDILVAGGSGDIQSTLLGSGCFNSYDPIVYVGTSSWITAHVPFKKTDLMHNIASLPSALPDLYFIAAEQESAGSALTYIRKILFEEPEMPDFSRLDSMADAAFPGSQGLVFLPWLYGERAPVESRNLRASFYNLSMIHGRNSIVRAVLEGVGYNLKWLLGIVERFSGRKFPSLKMAGGGAVSRLWPQIISDILEREIHVIVDPVYVNARGASVLARIAEKGPGTDLNPSVPDDLKIYRPDSATREAHSRNFGSFLQFYDNNRKHMDRLNGSRQR